ncbi:hypothetical protein OH77DRAFT_1068686 [Trametes cingulata]|nr:hypothetical protein OH77DRAFT_1068686 [Trametes cingulata]
MLIIFSSPLKAASSVAPEPAMGDAQTGLAGTVEELPDIPLPSIPRKRLLGRDHHNFVDGGKSRRTEENTHARPLELLYPSDQKDRERPTSLSAQPSAAREASARPFSFTFSFGKYAPRADRPASALHPSPPLPIVSLDSVATRGSMSPLHEPTQTYAVTTETPSPGVVLTSPQDVLAPEVAVMTPASSRLADPQLRSGTSQGHGASHALPVVQGSEATPGSWATQPDISSQTGASVHSQEQDLRASQKPLQPSQPTNVLANSFMLPRATEGHSPAGSQAQVAPPLVLHSPQAVRATSNPLRVVQASSHLPSEAIKRLEQIASRSPHDVIFDASRVHAAADSVHSSQVATRAGIGIGDTYPLATERSSSRATREGLSVLHVQAQASDSSHMPTPTLGSQFATQPPLGPLPFQASAWRGRPSYNSSHTAPLCGTSSSHAVTSHGSVPRTSRSEVVSQPFAGHHAFPYARQTNPRSLGQFTLPPPRTSTVEGQNGGEGRPHRNVPSHAARVHPYKSQVLSFRVDPQPAMSHGPRDSMTIHPWPVQAPSEGLHHDPRDPNPPQVPRDLVPPLPMTEMMEAEADVPQTSHPEGAVRWQADTRHPASGTLPTAAGDLRVRGELTPWSAPERAPNTQPSARQSTYRVPTPVFAAETTPVQPEASVHNAAVPLTAQLATLLLQQAENTKRLVETLMEDNRQLRSLFETKFDDVAAALCSLKTDNASGKQKNKEHDEDMMDDGDGDGDSDSDDDDDDDDAGATMNQNEGHEADDELDRTAGPRRMSRRPTKYSPLKDKRLKAAVTYLKV